MRVYEFAKQYNVSSRDVLELLKNLKFDVKSHMSVLGEKEIVLLKTKYDVASGIEKKEIAHVNTEKNAQKDDLLPMQKNITKSSSLSKETSKAKQNTRHTVQKIEKTTEKLVEKVSQQNIKSKKFFNRKKGKQEETVSLLESPLVLKEMSVGDFSDKTGLQVGSVIIFLLKEGQVCTKNHILSIEQVEKLASAHDIEIIKPSLEKKSTALDHLTKNNQILHDQQIGEKRLPVVVVMGHVDHGKTSLLDYIRNTRVALKEKGGITQHLGAYEAETSHGNLVFLDTPGHAAFSKIRQRGASVADIAVLVVAADDGIMPQTIESIKAIKSLKVPVVVAINKVDKVDKARLEIVKRQLSQHDLLPEEWGGDIVVAPISAKTGEGIDHLLEMLALQAELMELKANRVIPAQGYILESKIEKGRGSVATVLCRQGTLHVGDYFSVGNTWGKVTSLTDSSGQQHKQMGPSIPMIVTGFDELAPVGGLFIAVNQLEYKKGRGEKNAYNDESLLARNTFIGDKEVIPLLIKADSNSSLEAVIDGVQKITKNAEKTFLIIKSGIGAVLENDVILAETTGAQIIGFYVKVDQAALSYARKVRVRVNSFDIIYKLFEYLEEQIKVQKEVKKELVKIGEALVLTTFDVKKLGVIAGCQVKEGKFSRDGEVIIKRGRREIGKGKIKSLQRDKKSVKEVHTGFECAFLVDGFNEWVNGDVVECYLEMVV